MLLLIPTSHLRARLTEAVDAAIHHTRWVVITRQGKEVAAIVSMDQFHRILEDENIDLFGPINPETGRPMGAAWVKKTGWKRGMPAPWEEVEAGGDLSGEGETVERKRGWWGWPFK